MIEMSSVVNDINIKEEMISILKDYDIPENVTAFNNLEEAIKDTDYVVLAVPSHVIRSLCASLKGKI